MRFITFTDNVSVIFCLLLLLVIGPTPASGQSLLTQILNAIFGPIVERVCDTVQTELGLNETVDCSCEAESIGLFKGVKATLSCTLAESQCLFPPDLYCANGEIDINVSGGLFSNTAIESDFTGCFKVDSGLPSGIASIEKVCISFVPDGLKLKSCTTSIGGEDCNSCEICNSGIAFKFDCSNTDILSGAGRIPGPKITTCLGVSLARTT
jgi:hypothetical protein